jgi:hypothetical protein
VVCAFVVQGIALAKPEPRLQTESRLAARRAALAKAVQSVAAECRADAPPKEVLEKACYYKWTSNPEIATWPKPRIVQQDAFTFRLACLASCACLAESCTAPEVLLLGERGGSPSEFHLDTVRDDIDFYLEAKQRSSIAAQACLRTSPVRGDDGSGHHDPSYNNACNSPKRDEEGRAVVPGPRIQLLGPTSDARLVFQCEYRCPCEIGRLDCSARAYGPDPKAVVADPTRRATLEQRGATRIGERISVGCSHEDRKKSFAFCENGCAIKHKVRQCYRERSDCTEVSRDDVDRKLCAEDHSRCVKAAKTRVEIVDRCVSECEIHKWAETCGL